MTRFEQHLLIDETLNGFRSRLGPEECLPVDIERILAYIHRRLFDANLSVGGLLEDLSIRSNNYSTRFRRSLPHIGLPPLTIREYIEWQRIRAATFLLEHGQISFSQVAFSVGYEHYETFHRAFRRRTGYCPAQYVRRKRQEITSCSSAHASLK